MLIQIPEEQETCDYYVPNMLDLPLRFAYEVLSFTDKCGAKQILHEIDVIDVRLFLVEGLPALINAYEGLLAVSRHKLPDCLDKSYLELLKLYAMHGIAKAAYKIHRRFRFIDKQPWDASNRTEMWSYLEEKPKALHTKERYDDTDLEVYSQCQSFLHLLEHCVNSFRDYAPCWEYHAQNVMFFKGRSDSIKYYNREPYAPHADSDAAKYSDIKSRLIPLINANIRLHNMESVSMSEYCRTNVGKYVIYCNTNKVSQEQSSTPNFIEYILPFALADTEEEAKELFMEFKRPINVPSLDPYFTQVHYGQCKENGWVSRIRWSDDWRDW